MKTNENNRKCKKYKGKIKKKQGTLPEGFRMYSHGEKCFETSAFAHTPIGLDFFHYSNTQQSGSCMCLTAVEKYMASCIVPPTTTNIVPFCAHHSRQEMTDVFTAATVPLCRAENKCRT